MLKSICTLHTVMFLTGANDEGNCFCNIVLGGPIEKIAKTNDSHSFQIDTLKFFFCKSGWIFGNVYFMESLYVMFYVAFSL